MEGLIAGGGGGGGGGGGSSYGPHGVRTGVAPTGTPPSVEITYKLPSPATVTELSPNRGPTSGGTVVRIFGRNLSTPLAVYFDKVRTRIERVVSASEIEVVSPKGAGAVEVRVETSRGTSTNTRADRFYY